MDNQGHIANEKYFSSQQTNRNYAGPLDMPWLEEGMGIVQWRNGQLSSPLDEPTLNERFYHKSLPKNVFPECQCIWKVKSLTDFDKYLKNKGINTIP